MNWIRSFEAAGRHLNLSHAAAELGVTHGAISRQVAQLERHLGLPLFIRLTTGLSLTPRGQLLHSHIQQGFSQISAGLEAIRDVRERPSITLTVLPSFAIHWLVLRLSKFQKTYPEVDIRLLTTRRLVDLMREDVDLGLRYGLGHWPPLESELLLEDELILTASPSVAAEMTPLDPEKLQKRIIFSDRQDAENWRRWLAAAGLPPIDMNGRAAFDDTSISVQAALRGQGVILGRSSLIEQEMADGRLVALSAITIPSPYAMYIIYPPGVRENPHVAAFCDWLHQQAGNGESSALGEREAKSETDKDRA